MSEEREIEQLVQRYYESLYESDAEKVRSVFHEKAMIAGYLHGELVQMSLEEFAGFVAAQQPSPQESGAKQHLEIESVEYAGETGCVMLSEEYLGMTFFDTLSLLRVGGEWKVYNKLFHVED
ncbi:MAG: nuclear transport factor 2 family protein [Planctomycetes bacterium]|nr:nuclear transport factor 2 family protein [Planctomycetota bacterium]